MSCHARTVEGLSEALVSLRWAHEEGLSPRHSPPRRACTGVATACGPTLGTWPPAHQPHIRDRYDGGCDPLLLLLDREFHIPWREFHD